MSSKSTYSERFNEVFDYIDKHLEEVITLEQLSSVANSSKYHFHRQFSEYTGISIFRYIQLARLKRASYQLAFKKDEKIIDIALEAGFESPESFSRSFKNTFGQTPSAFRKKPAWKPWNERYKLPNKERKLIMNVRVVEFEQTKVASLKHCGSPELINETVKVFIDWRTTSGLSPFKSSKTFGIAYDDPNTTNPEDFTFDICGSVIQDVPENIFGVINSEIPAGRCAVVRHLGSHNRIGETVYYLFRNWLPDSGECLRDFPLYFHYLNSIMETPERELITDIYLPLK